MSYNLKRFLDAQERDYITAYSEIKAGYKKSCWMWYIFPQLQALGQSQTAIYYGIKNKDEAEAYLRNQTLAKHLYDMSYLLLKLPTNDALTVFGYPDDLKLQSCMTLFHIASGEKDNSVFKKVLNKFFHGEMDKNTINLLK